MGDIKEGDVLPRVEGGVDDAEVLVLHWHGPTCKGNHAATVGFMEVMESSPAQLIGALEKLDTTSNMVQATKWQL